MRRSILFLMLGIFCTALFVDAVSVYAFHEVDADKIGHWNQAYLGLTGESALFALLVGAAAGLLTLLGRRLFHLSCYSPHAKLSLFLGIGVTVVQYLWDFVGRKAFPNLADTSLLLYLVIAPLLSTVVLLSDIFRQGKLAEARKASSSVN